MNDGNDIENGSANSDVDAGPDTSRSTTMRRVGSAKALNTSSIWSEYLGTNQSVFGAVT